MPETKGHGGLQPETASPELPEATPAAAGADGPDVEERRPEAGDFRQDAARPDTPNTTGAPDMPDAQPDAAETPAAGAGIADDLPPPPSEPDLKALRSLLMQRELVLLDKLRERLDNPMTHAKEVSDVIAEALLLRAGKDDKLARSLEPVVESILKSSLRKNPLDFINVVFPLMGPAIRRAIAETFRSMLENFNKSVEMAFSWKGLRWRLEAMRAGKPFSEIVLLHTLVYRVEQVFLIHSATGLVLAHEVNEGVESQDADMVSAMLTAIQDFVNDSFGRGQQGELASLHLGDFTIMVERSPNAYLACVVRGTPPADFRHQMRTSLELILVEFYDELVSFKGDTAPFTLARRHLADLMVQRFVDEGKPLPLWVKALPVLLLAIAGGFGFWRYQDGLRLEKAAELAREEQEQRAAFYKTMNGYIDHLLKEPGLTVAGTRRLDSPPWIVVCMRDELARSPEEVITAAGGDLHNFQLFTTPYISLDPRIVATRVEQKIRPPEGVGVSFGDDGILRLTGTASIDWILQARQDALLLPGVKGVDLRGINDPRMQRIEALVREVEATSVRFPLGKDMPTPEDAPLLAAAVDALVALESMAEEMGLAVSLTIYGHADTIGNVKRNYEISQERARTLAAMLYARGSSLPVSMYGMGSDYADKAAVSPLGDPGSRRIELRVHLTRAGTAAEDLFSR